MSSPSLVSGFSPRIRHRRPTPSMLALNQQSRNALSRMLKHRTFKDELYAFYQRQAEGLPVIPTYLSNTMYAQLVKQQYLIFTKIATKQPANSEDVNLFQSKDPDEDLGIVFNGTASANQPKHTTAKVPSPQQYDALHSLLMGDSFKLALTMQDLRLPTEWDIKSKGEHIDISLDHMQLTYRGNGKDDEDVSSVRANYTMRKQCGIYYFEIQIMSHGKIGIGFCRRINSLDRFPGWEEHSWGYHGENGYVHSGPNTAKPYGPKYGGGDVIGCGIDFRDMSAFYTKNGIFLGTAFKEVKETDIYPFVGFKTAGEKIEANFGAKPYKFDIQQYMAKEKQDLLDGILLKPTMEYHTSSQSAIINASVANNLADLTVMDYLKHNGYNKSAKSLEKAILSKGNILETSSTTEDCETLHRQEIRKSVLEGDIDRVFRLCRENYSDVLDNNPMILFRLRCRKFVEMVKKVQQNVPQASLIDVEDEAQSLAVAQNKQFPPCKRTINNANLGYYLDNKKRQRTGDERDLISFVDIMAYGNKLQEQYANESQTNETMRLELIATFSTLAYADLSHRAVAYLFETPHLEQVASELNSALLVSLGKYPNSSLERIYRQTSTTIETLVLAGNAKAALFQPERDCFNHSDL